MRRWLGPFGFWPLVALTASGTARAEDAYKVEIVGIDEKELRKALEDASQLVKLKDRPPASEAALRRRIEDDIERLKTVANGEGYWEATLSYEVDADKAPPLITLRVEPGPRYTLQSVTFQTGAGGTPLVLDHYHPIAFGLHLGGPARSDPVIAAEGRIADAFASEGYPYGKVVSRNVVVDVATHTMAVTYTVDPGPLARFGPYRIEGLENVPRTYVERRIDWHEEEIYDSRAVEATRRALVDSGLFSSVRITPPPEPPNEAGEAVPMTIALTERLTRSVGAGLTYNTSEGFGARAFWEDRNLLGHADKLRLSAEFAQQRLGLSGAYRRPDLFGRRDTDFILLADIADETPQAYDSRKLRVAGGDERRFGPLVTGGAALAFEQAFIDDHVTTQKYTLVGVPLFLRHDTSNDLLNPTAGSRSSIQLTPWASVAGTNVDFVSTRAAHSLYRELDSMGRFVGAVFGAVGSIAGPDRGTIPADKRLYVGGGGSVRGYGYQRVGPLRADDKPLGGKGSLEFGTELRIRITESIGIVPFLEGGSVSAGSLPTGKLFFGTGIGVRYYTTLGPIRFDIGVPLNPRASDDPFQIYISLGQAF